ncbi:FadR/GntR family transcriptional regulator [Mycobacterium sp. pUA109]|uniref:FadR/GntR family transcriptional regulator n=1 Tax=Mycobacterium sp. pUA109 TaxID=3238982 RepID=UPI00351BA613
MITTQRGIWDYLSVVQGGSSSELHGNVLTAIGTGIVSGRYPAGQVLTLDALSAGNGVSRSVVREAIRVLESMGMVAARRRIGITVQPASSWNVFDPRLIRWRLDDGDRAVQLESLHGLRRGVAPAAAALAARRADPDQCRVMAAAVSDMVVHARSGDLDAYRLAHNTFHRTVLEASGNDMFRALHAVLAEAPSNNVSPEVIELHEQVGHAIRVGDAAAAERAMRQLF